MTRPVYQHNAGQSSTSKCEQPKCIWKRSGSVTHGQTVLAEVEKVSRSDYRIRSLHPRLLIAHKSCRVAICAAYFINIPVTHKVTAKIMETAIILHDVFDAKSRERFHWFASIKIRNVSPDHGNNAAVCWGWPVSARTVDLFKLRQNRNNLSVIEIDTSRPNVNRGYVATGRAISHQRLYVGSIRRFYVKGRPSRILVCRVTLTGTDLQ
jgi:hypothetical protein